MIISQDYPIPLSCLMVEGAYCNIATQHCNKPAKFTLCLEKNCSLPKEILRAA